MDQQGGVSLERVLMLKLKTPAGDAILLQVFRTPRAILGRNIHELHIQFKWGCMFLGTPSFGLDLKANQEDSHHFGWSPYLGT